VIHDALVTDMDEGRTVPEQRRREREIGIRELRNAGKVVAELAAAGAVGRATSAGVSSDGSFRPAPTSSGSRSSRPRAGSDLVARSVGRQAPTAAAI
jgi:hypothetical protein